VDLDKIFESSRYGDCRVVSYKDLLNKKQLMSKEVVGDTEKDILFNDFKSELLRRMQPIVENLVEYLRALEKSSKGKGLEEIETMLTLGDINKPMYLILVDSITDLDNEYKVDLTDNKYFNNENK